MYIIIRVLCCLRKYGNFRVFHVYCVKGKLKIQGSHAHDTTPLSAAAVWRQNEKKGWYCKQNSISPGSSSKYNVLCKITLLLLITIVLHIYCIVIAIICALHEAPLSLCFHLKSSLNQFSCDMIADVKTHYLFCNQNIHLEEYSMGLMTWKMSKLVERIVDHVTEYQAACSSFRMCLIIIAVCVSSSRF